MVGQGCGVCVERLRFLGAVGGGRDRTREGA